MVLAKSRISAPLVLLFAAVPTMGGPPGPQGGGVTLLPNGWRIAPAGRHITVGDLPLAMVESADGRYLIVSNNGYAKPTLVVVDIERMIINSRRCWTTPGWAWPGTPTGRGSTHRGRERAR